MDIKHIDAEPSAGERAAIDALIGPAVASDDGASRSRRHLLLPALQALQARVGWISEGGLGYVCDRFHVPPAEAWGVATFYALLSTSPRPPRIVHVCDDIACKCRGADDLIAELERTVGPAIDPSAPRTSDLGPRTSGWLRSPCLGQCDRAPAALVTIAGEQPREFAVGHVTAAAVRDLLTNDGEARRRDTSSGETNFSWSPDSPAIVTARGPLLRRVGRVDPLSLDAFRASGGFTALEKARAMGAERVIAEVTASNLLGRGGAAFPTGRKWLAVRAAPARPHYVVCNADESEPGTFKDRVLMEEDPFAIVEAIAIAAFAVDSGKAFIYVRGEYPLAAARLAHALDASRREGLLEGLDVEIRRGGGAYICGEETALFESIEGKRGEPRNKPPFPVDVGLFGKPTLVNNVETLANIPQLILDGAQAFASIGTTASTGTRLFCLCGSVRVPGLYEVPFGTPLRSLIELAGGVAAGRALQAVLLGGAAGTFLRPDDIDLRLTHEDTRAAGATLGSGVVMVIDDTVDIRALLHRIAAFFRDESCGQCVPCRVGTVRQEEALHRLAHGGDVRSEIALLNDVGLAMKDASICGLGQTAYAAIESAIVRLRVYGEAR